MPDPVRIRACDATLRKSQITPETLRARDEENHTAGPLATQRQLDLVEPARRGTAAAVDTVQLAQACEEFRQRDFRSLTHLLPMLFRLRGECYTLDNHFPFEPLFRTQSPNELTLIAGRQVAKSTSMAAWLIATSMTRAYFSSLYVAPLFEMTRRFSSNYVQPFINESPVRGLMVDAHCNRSVLQRTFINKAALHFSFAYLDPSRIRGLSADAVCFDEAQDIDPDHVPIIQETMSGSPFAINFYAGTAKTNSAFLAECFVNSSQAQWHIRCACGYENIPARTYDLDRMIGPDNVRREISEAQPGVVCAKCQQPIYPRTGRWVHHFPDRLPRHPGYHIPQVILPVHYADPSKWATLLGKRLLAPNVFYNEVCGESYDVGAKLISETELRAACNPQRANDLATATRLADSYVDRVVAVDWGGGGVTQISRTVITALGLRPDGRIDVVFAHRFRAANDFAAETAGILALMQAFQAAYVVHDFGGQGVAREELLVQTGIPLANLIPVAYVAQSAKTLMRHVPVNPMLKTRAHYQVNKTRSLLQTCELIRHKQLEFYACDYVNRDSPGLIFDFLSLVENVIEGTRGMDTYMIVREGRGSRKGGKPDDFAQAVNIGCCALFYRQGHGGVAPHLAPTDAILAKLAQATATFEVEDIDWQQY
jgi:hypothetical protein